MYTIGSLFFSYEGNLKSFLDVPYIVHMVIRGKGGRGGG